MKKHIFLFCLIGLFTTSSLWATGLSGIIIAGGGGTVSSVPAAPTGVSATAGNAQNTVTWSASSGSTSCNLYWKSGSSMSGNCTGNGTKISGVTSPDVITSLTNGTTYYYMLTCVNAAGESSCSSEVSATPNVTVSVPGAADKSEQRQAMLKIQLHGLHLQAVERQPVIIYIGQPPIWGALVQAGQKLPA